MTKKTKLKICDITLLPLTLLMLASGVQLEVMHGGGLVWLIVHIILGLIFMGFVGWHIFLHFGSSDWFARFHKLKSQFTRILWWVGLLTLVSGIAVIFQWCIHFGHSPLGGIHGKLGFLMILLIIFHVAKRYNFYTRCCSCSTER